MKDIKERKALKRVHNEIMDEYNTIRKYLMNLQRNTTDVDVPDNIKKKLDDSFKKHLDDVEKGNPDPIIEKKRNRK